jgi:hypothetical protein
MSVASLLLVGECMLFICVYSDGITSKSVVSHNIASQIISLTCAKANHSSSSDLSLTAVPSNCRHTVRSSSWRSSCCVRCSKDKLLHVVLANVTTLRSRFSQNITASRCSCQLCNSRLTCTICTPLHLLLLLLLQAYTR